MVLWNSYRSAEDLQFWLKRLAYFSAPTNMAWLRINRSYFECSPRVISDPWTSWRKTSLSKSYKSKLGRVLHLLYPSSGPTCSLGLWRVTHL